MKRKALIVGCLAIVILMGIAVWLFAASSSSKISLTLVGYTNNITGIPMFRYATNKISSAGFALFRAHNPTKDTFACYVGPIILHRAVTGADELIEIQGTVHTHARGNAPIAGDDFDLSPGATKTFAVPAPDVHGTWRDVLLLTHIHNYKHQWQYDLAVFAQRCGIHIGEEGQTVISEAISH